MSFEVLKQRQQIHQSRALLDNLGASAIDRGLTKFLKSAGLKKGVLVGEDVKSWDILQTIQLLKNRLTNDARIVDIGCYASELIVSLHKVGFRNLYGVDLNEKIKEMPHADTINYVISDFMETPFEDHTFDAVTSISVIEHGYDDVRLLKEAARLLKPGGYFVASFDYWPEKIDTTGVKFFGMDWLIFSKEDVKNLVARAEDFGFEPVGPLRFESESRCIDCAQKQYTFAWLALRKKLS